MTETKAATKAKAKEAEVIPTAKGFNLNELLAQALIEYADLEKVQGTEYCDGSEAEVINVYEARLNNCAKRIWHIKMGLVRDQIGPVVKSKLGTEKFASIKHGDVVAAIRPMLSSAGLSIIPFGIHSQGIVPNHIKRFRTIPDSANPGKTISQEYEVTLYQALVKLKCTITCLHTGYSEEAEIDGTAINNEGDPAKSFGSALSYTKKYFYMQMFDINDTASDPDAGINQEAPTTDPGDYKKDKKEASAPAATQPATKKARKAVSQPEFEKIKADLLNINSLEELSKEGARLSAEYSWTPVQLAAFQNEVGAHKKKLEAAEGA